MRKSIVMYINLQCHDNISLGMEIAIELNFNFIKSTTTNFVWLHEQLHSTILTTLACECF